MQDWSTSAPIDCSAGCRKHFLPVWGIYIPENHAELIANLTMPLAHLTQPQKGLPVSRMRWMLLTAPLLENQNNQVR
jgi:hypothetical protein